MVRRRFVLALALSALLHVVVVTGPAWQLASDAAQKATALEAHLLPPPAPQAAVQRVLPPKPPAPTPRRSVPQPRAAAPRPPPPAAPAEAPAAPVAATESAEQPSDRGMAAVGGELAAPADTPSAASTASDNFDVPLPGAGRIRFDVMVGANGFVVGESMTTWQLDEKTYSIRNVAETTGLVSLFKRAKATQTSEGEVTAKGLVPREYALIRSNSGKPSEAARFDWAARKITLQREDQTREVDLLDGSFDILSLIYQFAWFLPHASTLEIPVATGKNYYRQRFEVLGEEQLSLRLGQFRTLHLRVGRAGDNITDVWLALDYKNLPLRIRHTGKKGDIFEQQATEVRYGDVNLLAPAR